MPDMYKTVLMSKGIRVILSVQFLVWNTSLKLYNAVPLYTFFKYIL